MLLSALVCNVVLTLPLMLCWTAQFVKFAVLCSTMQILLFVRACDVSVENLVVHVGGLLFF